jgi:hypothetical protein
LSADNDWTGVNTYNTTLPTSTQTPTNDEDLTTKVFVDESFTNFLGADNDWTGVNTYNTTLPTSTQTPTNDEDLTTKVYVDTTPPFLPLFKLTNTSVAFPSSGTQSLIAIPINDGDLSLQVGKDYLIYVSFSFLFQAFTDGSIWLSATDGGVSVSGTTETYILSRTTGIGTQYVNYSFPYTMLSSDTGISYYIVLSANITSDVDFNNIVATIIPISK